MEHQVFHRAQYKTQDFPNKRTTKNNFTVARK